MKPKDRLQRQTKMPKQQKQLSYAEWMTRLFKKFSKEMEYIKKNTTDHERAQMSRANAVGSPNDKMSLRDIYNETVSYTHLCTPNLLFFFFFK